MPTRISGSHAVVLESMLADSDLDFVDGIVCRTPKQRPAPKFYDDDAYRKFIAALPQLHAAHYNDSSLSGRLERAMKQDCFRLVAKAAAPPILDLGCGDGSGFNFLGGADRIIGLDSNLELLRKAKELHPAATLISAPLHDLPLKDHCVPTMFAFFCLEHVFYLEESLQEVARCLRPDGNFYVAVPTEGGLAVELARFFTSRRNAQLIGITPQQSTRAQRKDHCNTLFAIENALRKFFRIEAQSAWPFRLGGSIANLSKNYRLRAL